MAPRRVYLIWTHPLFHEAVRGLLKHPDVEWLGATSDPEVALKQIVELRPETVLIEELEGGIPPEALEILETCPWELRVVGLSLADNTLSVYHREQRTVAQPEDLLDLIRNDEA